MSNVEQRKQRSQNNRENQTCQLSRFDREAHCFGYQLTVSWGAFHYTRPTSRRPVGLTKGKWNDVKLNRLSSNAIPILPAFSLRPMIMAIMADEAAGLKRRSQVQEQVDNSQVAVLQISKQAQKCLLDLITIQNAVLYRSELFGSVTN